MFSDSVLCLEEVDKRCQSHKTDIEGRLLGIKCILHAVVNSLCGLGSCPLVWHMHSVCLLHGHVAHSSHSAEESDSRFASEWETHLPLS